MTGEKRDYDPACFSDAGGLAWGEAHGESILGTIERRVADYYDVDDEDLPIGDQWMEENRVAYPKPHCVYVLRCNNPRKADTLIDVWKFWFDEVADEIPSWAWAAYYSDQVYYVGYTADPYSRISAHVEAPNEGARFVKTFPPHEIEELHWFDFEDDARIYEEQRAEELSDSDTFVSQH